MFACFIRSGNENITHKTTRIIIIFTFSHVSMLDKVLSPSKKGGFTGPSKNQFRPLKTQKMRILWQIFQFVSIFNPLGRFKLNLKCR